MIACPDSRSIEPISNPPVSAPRFGTAPKALITSGSTLSMTSKARCTATGFPGISHRYAFVAPGAACVKASISGNFQSYQLAGILYLVSTPIGNLEDITFRAVRVLREADLIACEDTRQTRKLLDHYGISKPTVSYHEHNEAARAAELTSKLQAGSTVALVSDAGTPLISDPGYRLVQSAIAAGVSVVPIPGPSAALSALAASGLPTDSFRFCGFLPPRQTQRRKMLEDLRAEGCTLMFY